MCTKAEVAELYWKLIIITFLIIITYSYVLRVYLDGWACMCRLVLAATDRVCCSVNGIFYLQKFAYLIELKLKEIRLINVVCMCEKLGHNKTMY